MQPDLTVSRTYTSPMCFQDSIDKELMAERSFLEPLPDLKAKGQKIKLLKARFGGSQLFGGIFGKAGVTEKCTALQLQSEG